MLAGRYDRVWGMTDTLPSHGQGMVSVAFDKLEFGVNFILDFLSLLA